MKIRGIILAAGRGRRMGAHTDQLPKCLLKIDGKSLLQRQIDALKHAGITDIALVTGYRRELISHYCENEFHNSHWASTNMVKSLSCADSWLSTGVSIVSYADIFYDPSAILSLVNTHSDLAITYDVNWLTLWSKRFKQPLEDAETFKIDTDGNLMEIGGKPKTTGEIQGQYMGLLRISHHGWQEIRCVINSLQTPRQNKIDMTSVLDLVIKRDNIKIKTHPYTKIWGEIDQPSDLENCI